MAHGNHALDVVCEIPVPIRARGSSACSSRALASSARPDSTTRSKAARWLPEFEQRPSSRSRTGARRAGWSFGVGVPPDRLPFPGHLLDEPLHGEHRLGEPNPRYAPAGVLFVTTAVTPTAWRGIRYGPAIDPAAVNAMANPGG